MKRLIAIAVLVSAPLSAAAQSPKPKFEPQTLDDGVQIGYGVVVGEVNGDGHPDILLADKNQYRWYENPGEAGGEWESHVMAEDLTGPDNVCIDARDINGDGKVEVAVGARWNPGNNTNPEESGALFYLVRPEDPTQEWEAVQIQPHEPTIHRIRWIKTHPQAEGARRFSLIALPLRARPDAEGVKILAYRVPEDPSAGEWETTLVNDTMHMTHNMDVVPAPQSGGAEYLLVAGREGVLSAGRGRNGQWRGRVRHPEEMSPEGAGEVRAGQNVAEADYEGIYATIEPMHGNQAVAYTANRDESAPRGEQWSVQRHVLDDSLSGGHAIWVADFLGLRRDQVVAGWRNPNDDEQVGIKLYVPTDAAAENWETHWVDKDGMACEYLVAGDLNGDDKPDIVASGRATNNLKVYWNRTGSQ